MRKEKEREKRVHINELLDDGIQKYIDSQVSTDTQEKAEGERVFNRFLASARKQLREGLDDEEIKKKFLKIISTKWYSLSLSYDIPELFGLGLSISDLRERAKEEGIDKDSINKYCTKDT